MAKEYVTSTTGGSTLNERLLEHLEFALESSKRIGLHGEHEMLEHFMKSWRNEPNLHEAVVAIRDLLLEKTNWKSLEDFRSALSASFEDGTYSKTFVRDRHTALLLELDDVLELVEAMEE